MGMSRISAMFTADTSGLQAGANRAGSAMRQMRGDVSSLEAAMNRLQKAVNLNTLVQFGQLAAQAAGKLYSAMAPAIGSAVSLGEELSKSAQIFGDNAGEIDKFAKSAAALGMTRVQALEAAGSFGNMFTSMKLGTDQSAEMSLTFTRLAADLASFNNTSVDEAITALGATLRGESEPIRRFGVLLDDATLRAKAFELGMTSSAKDAMTPAIKAQAAYAAVLEQTAKAQGDFARTSGGLANMGRQLQAEAGNAAQTLGAAFVPVLESFGAGVLRTFQQLQPMIAEASNWLIEAWNRVGPAVTAGALNFAELVARGFDIGAKLVGAAFDYVREVFNFFAGLIPDFGVQIDWFGVVVEVFQRAVSLAEGVFSAGSAVFNGVIGGILKAVAKIVEAATWLAEKLNFSVDRIKAVSEGLNSQAQGWLDAAAEDALSAADKVTNAFSSDFKPTEMGQKLTKALTEGFDGGMEDWVEQLRQGAVAGGAEVAKIAANAGVVAGKEAAATIEQAKVNSAIDATSSAAITWLANAQAKGQASETKKQTGLLADIRDGVLGMIPTEAVAIP